MERRLAVAAGARGDVDEDAVAARKQIPVIRRVLDRDLPAAIVHCLRVHRLAAHAIGARYVWEIADEPECLGSRHRVIGLAEAVMEILERYPYLVEDELLMANLITLRSRVVPICSNCLDLAYPTQSAPLLCPTASTARIDPERVRDAAE
jgi:serine phosphatase RsbU (regulator of sigma subunit)